MNQMDQSSTPIPVFTDNRGAREDDPFNLNKLRLSQDFSANLGVKKALLMVPVRKPNRQEFIRVHPGEDWRLETMVLELKEKGETFLVDPELWEQLPEELTPKILYPAINRQGVLTLWPIRLAGEDGRLDNWNQSALEAAEIAKTYWTRIAANMGLGAYDVFQAMAELPDPEWPDRNFQDIVEIAFKDRFIRSFDHPVLRRLRGEI
jgi:hypothetical protein